MRIGVMIFLVMSLGCAGFQTSGRTDMAGPSSHEVCRASQQNAERGRVSIPTCHSHSLWWNDVGDALNGAATAVRFPKP